MPNSSPHTPADKIKALEAFYGSLSKLAKKIGLSYSYLHQIKSGKFKPSTRRSKLITRHFNQVFYPPDPPLPRCWITFKDPALYLKFKKLTMEDRRAAAAQFFEEDPPPP